jgi:polyphosphate kinase
VKARLQQPDGSYLRAGKLMKDTPPFSAQEFLMQLAEGKTELESIPAPGAKRQAKSAETAATAAD